MTSLFSSIVYNVLGRLPTPSLKPETARQVWSNAVDRPGAYELFPPWDLERWRQVDDSIRGGGSESVFTNWWRDSLGRHGVTFGGVLGACPLLLYNIWLVLTHECSADTTTLGGAGFASQRFTYDQPLNLERNSSNIRAHGLRLHIHPLPLRADCPHMFTLTLKTSSPDKRTRSQLTYEAKFEAPIPGGVSIPTYTVTIDFPFAKFEPYYRGRKVEKGDPRWQKLDLRQVWEVGVMCRSGFGQQSGMFALVLFGIDVVLERAEEGVKGSIWEWWMHLVRRVQIWSSYLTRFGGRAIEVWTETEEMDEKRALLGP